jgi:hypothetical protein
MLGINPFGGSNKGSSSSSSSLLRFSGGGSRKNPGIYNTDVFGNNSRLGANGQPIPGFGGTSGLSSTPTYPGFDDLRRELQQYRSELAAGNDVDATNALARERDLASGMAAEAGQSAAFRVGSRSGIPGAAAGQVLGGAKRDLSGLNANLASDARSQRLNALMGEANVLGSQAGVGLAQQNFNNQWWQSQQSNALAWQQAQALRDDRMWELLAGFYQG